MPGYVITCVLPDGLTKSRKPVAKAPPDAYVADFVLRNKAQFGTRYFPSKKGWLLFDCREAKKIEQTSAGGQRVFHRYEGIVRSTRVYPTEDAAVMHAIALSAMSR